MVNCIGSLLEPIPYFGKFCILAIDTFSGLGSGYQINYYLFTGRDVKRLQAIELVAGLVKSQIY